MSPRKKVTQALKNSISVEGDVPLIHIVSPMETQEIDQHKVDVSKPTELHVIGDERDDFKTTFPSELLEVVSERRDKGERKIHIVYDTRGPHAGFISQVAGMMGFYSRGRRLCIDCDEFAEKQKGSGRGK